MPAAKRENPVYKTLNKTMTLAGVEISLFVMCVGAGAVLYFFFNTLIGGIVIFSLCFILARWMTNKDPKMFLFVVQAVSRKFHAEYDPCKYKPPAIRRVSRRV